MKWEWWRVGVLGNRVEVGGVKGVGEWWVWEGLVG